MVGVNADDSIIDLGAGAGSALRLVVAPDFPVTPYSHFLINHLPDVRGKTVLDFGCGSGIISLAAATAGARSVVACDVSPRAVDVTQSNADLNGFATTISSRLLVPGSEVDAFERDSLELILCNPASLPTLHPEDGFFSGGADGIAMIEAMIEVAAKALRPGGSLHYVHTSLANLSAPLTHLERQGFASGITAVMTLPFRDHYEALFPNFVHLRQLGRTFFQGSSWRESSELLYLVEARRFPAG